MAIWSKARCAGIYALRLEAQSVHSHPVELSLRLRVSYIDILNLKKLLPDDILIIVMSIVQSLLEDHLYTNKFDIAFFISYCNIIVFSTVTFIYSQAL